MRRRAASFSLTTLPHSSSTGGMTPTHNEIPRTMVDDLGRVATNDDDIATQLVTTTQRFRVKLSERDIVRQVERRVKFLAQFNLPAFQPKSEEEFENWVDEAAQVINKNQVCVSLFQDAWSAVSPPSLARHIGSIHVADTHEELVNQVAAIFFKSPTYVRRFEVSLLQPKRHPTVFEARIALEDNVARYHRLCQRWSHPFHLSNVRCVELALQSLPVHLEEDIRAFYDDPEWDRVWKRAESREERMKHQSTFLAFPALNNPLLSDDAPMQESRPSQPQASKRTPPSPCPACLQNHWRKDCPYKKTKCFNCGLIGHVSKACRNLAVKDHTGRIDTRVQPKESGVTVHQRKDRTQTDKMQTAEGTIAGLREVATQRSVNAAQKRHDKRQAEGKPVRPRFTHPVALSQLQPSEDEESEDDKETEEERDSLQQIEGLFVAQEEEEPMETVVMIHALINNQQRSVIADTGAARNLINKQDAKELNIEVDESGKSRYFEGLGCLVGQPSKSTNVTLGSRTKSVTFYIVDKPGLPPLISRSNLAQFDVFVDPVTSHLVDRATLEVVATSIDYKHQQQPAEIPKIDVITQKKLGASDDELLEDGKKVIFEKVAHLLPDLQQRVWKLFEEFKVIWLRPRPGAVKNHIAQ